MVQKEEGMVKRVLAFPQPPQRLACLELFQTLLLIY